MNYWEKAQAMPESEKKKILLALDGVRVNFLASSPRRTLMKIFNKYINKTPSDPKCGGCNRKIYNFWKEAKENGKLS